MDLSDLIKAISERKEKTRSYDTTAVVRRIEGRTAWVHIPGGVEETPVKMTIKASPGDTVQIRIGGGKAWITGNASAPPTDDTLAMHATRAVQLVEKAVSKVKEVAESAQKIAGNTNQYFWHTEEGSDTGAHITEIPQEEFLEDPSNGGGNLLARSNGVAVRNGLTELATFGESLIELGKNSRTAVIKLCKNLFSIGASASTSSTIGVFQMDDTYDASRTESRQTNIIVRARNAASSSLVKMALLTLRASAYFNATIAELTADQIDLQGETSVTGTYAGRVVGQILNTTWTTPTITSSAVTISAGGYYTEGKRVYIQMRCVLAAQLNADTARQIFSGMPVPKDADEVALCINVRSRHGASCFVDSTGAMKIVADPDHSISANQNITITGVYTTTI